MGTTTVDVKYSSDSSMGERRAWIEIHIERLQPRHVNVNKLQGRCFSRKTDVSVGCLGSWERLFQVLIDMELLPTPADPKFTSCLYNEITQELSAWYHSRDGLGSTE